MTVKLYSIERKLGGATYSSNIACESGGIATGTDIHEVSAVPAPQLMDFVASVCDEPPRWKYNAPEQLEAFLSIGWPSNP